MKKKKKERNIKKMEKKKKKEKAQIAKCLLAQLHSIPFDLSKVWLAALKWRETINSTQLRVTSRRG
jgi:hypothetical protein